MKRHILILAAFAVACSTPAANQTENPASDSPELTRTAADDRPEPEVDDEPQPFRLEVNGERPEWFVVIEGEKEGYAVAFAAMPSHESWNSIRPANGSLSRMGAWITRSEHKGTLADSANSSVITR